MSVMYPQAPPAPVDRDIHGQLVAVEVRNAGWHRFSILEDGNQYPTKVDTKKPELVNQAMALMQQQVSANMREQQSTNINPHNGQPYTNRYLNAISPRGFAPGVQPYQQPQPQQPQAVYQPSQTAPQPQYQPAAQPQPQAPQYQPGIAGFDKDVNIMRQTASKVVAMSLPSLPPEKQTLIGMIEVCEAWLAYYTYGPLRFGVRPFDAPRQPEQPQAFDEPAGVYAAMGDDGSQRAGEEPCPDCGFVGQHSVGCPRAQYA
jgi:hypothetical protein